MFVVLQYSAVDPARILLDAGDKIVKAYSNAAGKPFATVRLQLAARKSESEPRLLAFTIVNESTPDIEVRKAWFLTNFNRQIFIDFITSRLPVTVRGNNQSAYFFPFDDLKATLNSKETIIQAFIYDKGEHVFSGRVDEAVEKELLK